METLKRSKLGGRDYGELSLLETNNTTLTMLNEGFDNCTFGAAVEPPNIARKKTKDSIPSHEGKQNALEMQAKCTNTLGSHRHGPGSMREGSVLVGYATHRLYE